MKVINYKLFDNGGNLLYTSIDFKLIEEILETYRFRGWHISLYANDDLINDVEAYRIGLERANAWKDEVMTEEQKKGDQINPQHYKDIVPGMQYMEMMQYMLANFEGVEAHLRGQIYKYMMRSGKKDEKVQELQKVKWYVDFLLAYLMDPDNISIADIEKILKGGR